ncbi:MAG: hypothetical protein HZA58_06070 [Acidimicrobiia bacterium]|nr:hypothetical protein [Acidimicrobiia bacterium]
MRIRPTIGDLSGAVGDLGVMVPLVAALVLVNGLDPGAVLIAAGALVIAAGVVFRIPFPVQPLKALTALAVAQSLSPDVIHSAGLQVGLILVLLAATGLAGWLARLFTRAVIRSLQFAVGVLLVVTAVRLALDSPAIFENPPTRFWNLALTAATLALVAVAASTGRYLVIGLVFAGGVIVGIGAADVDFGAVTLHAPSIGLPPWSVAWSAFVLLVVPQIPLTYGNAVVGVSDLAREHFGDAARRVTPGRVALSCGVGNLVSAAIGGMPMCHGSSGFTAHVRLGARTSAMNLVLGSIFLALGLVFSNQVLVLFGLLPVWALGGFLAYAGVRHAMLIMDLRRVRLAVALIAGLVGIVFGNLAITTGVAILAEHGPAMTRRMTRRKTPAD